MNDDNGNGEAGRLGLPRLDYGIGHAGEQRGAAG